MHMFLRLGTRHLPLRHLPVRHLSTPKRNFIGYYITWSVEIDPSDMTMPFEHFLVVDNRRRCQDVSCEDSCRDSWDIAHNE